MAIVKSLQATKTLSNQLKYLQKEGKTRENLKEGINCNVENVEREFNTIKLLHGKTEGKQYYHFTQAFSPGDNITPEKANELGKEWIQNNIKYHQIYIVTHIDKSHIHNHFVINSVNMENGNKLQISPKKLFEMKNDSNRICAREGLTQIDVNKKADIKKTMAELGMELRGITTWKDEVRQCIDFARERSNNLEELKDNLKENFKITIRETQNSISFKHPEQGKSVRGKKLGNKYTKEELENGFIRKGKEIERARTRESSRTQGNTIKGDREQRRSVDWSAVASNVKNEGSGVSEQFGNEVTGAIQQKVRDVKERTKRVIGISKPKDRGFEKEQRHGERNVGPTAREPKSEDIRTSKLSKKHDRKRNYGIER